MKITIAIIFVSIIISCEKVVYFDVKTQEGRLVVNSFIQPDSLVDLTVSLSTDPLAVGFENVRVNDATIGIFKNDVFLGNFNFSYDGNYSFPANLINATPDDNFKIEASAPGRATVIAETSIPSAIIIEEAKITDTIFVNIQYSAFDSLGNYYVIDTVVPHYQVQITFTDPEGDDFYSLKINYEDFYSSTYTCFTTDDPVFTAGDYDFGNGTDEEGTVTLCDEVYFTDITFDGKQKTLTVSLLELPTEFITDPKFVFRLNHLSEEYYKYIASSSLQSSTGENPFGEPVIVFSNIANGFGIFAGLTSAFAEVEL
ncbi:MAG: DUF4249 domain-containing protein [Chitinophagales bacterium]